jgi:hypothetical protein
MESQRGEKAKETTCEGTCGYGRSKKQWCIQHSDRVTRGSLGTLFDARHCVGSRMVQDDDVRPSGPDRQPSSANPESLSSHELVLSPSLPVQWDAIRPPGI